MTSTSLARPTRCRPLGQDARAGVDPGGAPDAPDDAPGPEGLGHLVPTADFLFASGGVLLEGDRGHDLDLPSLAEAGAHEIDTRVRVALAGRDGAVVAGLVPFDPCERPDLFVVRDPARHRWAAHLPLAGDPTGGTASGVATTPVDTTIAGVAAADDEVYRDAVAAALHDIGTGRLDKVVLARTLELDVRVSPRDVWTRLAARNPYADTFAVRRADGVFVGASPELVAEIGPDGFATHPLAGSTPRGGTAAVDAARGSALLASGKDRLEHRFVVDHIVARLAPLLGRLDVPAAPGLFATDAMMHLGTRITGRLRGGVGSLEAALTIHPTPAVCGVPGPRALEAIRRLEPGERGPYAGLVGWTDARGHGRWALALRCAHVGPDTARLYAGAGVVTGSTPDGEHAETAAKFATMTAALTTPHVGSPAESRGRLTGTRP